MIEIKLGAQIENPRGYDPGAVDQLRDLLEAGIPMTQDPRRKNFYEVEGQGENYYILISPVSGNVVLLAKWLRHPQDCCLTPEHLVA